MPIYRFQHIKSYSEPINNIVENIDNLEQMPEISTHVLILPIKSSGLTEVHVNGGID